MREREEEIKSIHRGMQQVNDIYKVSVDSIAVVLCMGVCAVTIESYSIVLDAYTFQFFMMSITGFGTLGGWTTGGD
jgi:hypothetical protein